MIILPLTSPIRRLRRSIKRITNLQY